MPKFFVKAEQIEENKVTIIGMDANHISKVLRLKNGDIILICNCETAKSYNAQITNIQREKVECIILEEIKEEVESKINVTLFQGLPKSDKMEYIIQKAVELGVKEIVPVAMERCVVKIEKGSKDELKKIDRWQKIVEAAAKQSKRNIIPKVQNITSVKQVCEEMKKYNYFIIAYEEEKENTLKKELKKITPSSGEKIGVMVGPEGGIDSKELEKLSQAGAKIVTLGGRILRTETAPIMLISNIMYEYEM